MLASESALSFRPCRPDDVDASVPLILSSGPGIYRCVFSISHAEEAVDYVRYAFQRKRGQLSYTSHVAIISGGQQVGVAGVATSATKWSFLLAAVVSIFGFYGFVRGLRVIYRGLKLESVCKPPRSGAALLYNFAVNASERGRGAGRALIVHLLEKLASEQVPRLGLDVDLANSRAKALYEKVGFSTVEVNAADLKTRFGHLNTHHYMEMSTGLNTR